MEAAWDWSLKRPVRGWDGVRVRKWGVMAGHPPPTPLEFGILGAVAQLGERCVRNAEVEGSTPFRSIFKALQVDDLRGFFIVASGMSRQRHWLTL